MTKICAVLLLIVMSFSSCKEDDPDPVAPACVGGKGGNVTMNTRTVHHNRPIKGCKVYIKYNTNSFPGEITSAYDDSLQIPDDTVATSFTNLKCGKYYLYATGIDSLLDPSVWIVKGGLPFSTDLNDGSIDVTIYVTEGD